jgi:hypothetical protein
MKPQFQHQATTSVALWLDHHLTYKAEAWSNKTGAFYYNEDTRLPYYPDDLVDGLITYSSEFKQWVYDSDVAGATIPSGIYIDTGAGYSFVARGESGLRLDFENGRVLLSGASFPTNYASLNITGSFAVKDVNIYLTDDTEENLVLQNKYNVNSRTVPDYGKGTGIPPYEQVAPAAFITMDNAQNVPFAFGGEDLTNLNYRVVFFSENLYQLDGALSVSVDTFNMGVTNIGYDDFPLDEYGDLKTGSFSYTETVKNCTLNPKLMFVEDAKASKVSDRLTRATNPDLFLGFVDLEISQARFPRL